MNSLAYLVVAGTVNAISPIAAKGEGHCQLSTPELIRGSNLPR